METLTDNALMTKVKNGNLDALGLLFRRYQKPILGFFYRMNSDLTQSEDLVQMVFERVLRYREQFRAEGEFRTWLFHIARNVQHDAFRKQQKQPVQASLSGYEQWAERLGTDKAADDDLEKVQNLALLDEALQRLSPDKREILILSRFEELKYSQIADILNITENNVKIKVFRALQDLKRIYQHLEYEKNT